MIKMLKKNKKGMSMDFLVALIIVILSFMLTAGTVFRYLSKAEPKQAEALCKDSVALRAATALQFGSTELKVSPILCKTIDEKISGTPVEVEEQIASHMAKCWQMFGEGRYGSSVFNNINIMKGQNKCFMCYSLVVEESKSFKETDTGINAEKFMDFLRTQKYPQGKNLTYLNYFQFGGGEGRVWGVLDGKEGIKPGRAYAVAFQAKETTCGKLCEVASKVGLTTAIVGSAFLTIGTGGLFVVGVTVAGATLAVLPAAEMISEEYFKPTELDSIILVDMANPELQKVFSRSCEFVPDVSGK